MSASMTAVLTEAILWAKNEPQDSRLITVDFGRRQDGHPGFWWAMRFIREIKDGEVVANYQDDEARFAMIVTEWSRVKAWLEDQEAGGQHGG